MPKTTHTLLHLGQQVRKLGPLWTASCFPFESFYHYAVKLINGTRYALHQVSFHFFDSPFQILAQDWPPPAFTAPALILHLPPDQGPFGAAPHP